LLVHAIPETCAEGLSWSTPRRRGGVRQLSSALQPAGRNLFLRLRHGPGGTRCRPRLAAAATTVRAHTGELGERELRMPQVGPQGPEGWGSGQRSAAFPQRLKDGRLVSLPLPSGRFLGPRMRTWAGVQCRAVCFCFCVCFQAPEPRVIAVQSVPMGVCHCSLVCAERNVRGDGASPGCVSWWSGMQPGPCNMTRRQPVSGSWTRRSPVRSVLSAIRSAVPMAAYLGPKVPHATNRSPWPMAHGQARQSKLEASEARHSRHAPESSLSFWASVASTRRFVIPLGATK
jgi:hypothetical protein